MDYLRQFATGVFGPRRATREGIILDQGTIESREPETFPDESKGVVSWKTLFSSNQTATDSLTAGIASCPPRQGHLCPHRHKQAEIYHIISGKGIMQIDDQEHEVVAGSVVYIPGDAKHGIRNEDLSQELKWFYVFGTDSFQDIKYRF